MDLPAASPLVVHTLESPRFFVALLILGAGFAWFGLRFRYPRQALISTGGLLLLAAGLVVLATLVETTGERLERETRALVDAAVGGEVAVFADMLEEDLVLKVGRDQTALDKADLVSRVKALGELVKSNNIREVQGVGIGDGQGESVLAQTTTTHVTQPTPNEWRFYWTRGSDGRWRVKGIVWEEWGFSEVPTADLLRK